MDDSIYCVCTVCLNFVLLLSTPGTREDGRTDDRASSRRRVVGPRDDDDGARLDFVWFLRGFFLCGFFRARVVVDEVNACVRVMNECVIVETAIA